MLELAGERGNQCQNKCRGEKQQGITRTLRGPACHYFVQCHGEHDAGHDSGSYAYHRRAEDDSKHVSFLRAKRKANAKFIGPLNNRVGDNAVESDRRECQRQGSECPKEPRDQLTTGLLRHTGDPMLKIANIVIGLLVGVD